MSRIPDLVEASPSRDETACAPPNRLVLGRSGLFRVALVDPEIPPNVGAVSRTCAATGCPLYLVGKISFREDHPARRRAGLDYWDLVEKTRVESLDGLRALLPGAGFHLFSKKAGKSLFEKRFSPGDVMVFGPEALGLDEGLLAEHPDEACRIPMRPEIRSLNVATAVGIVLYEALRQVEYGGACLEARP